MPLNEFEFSWSKISDIQPQLEKLVMKNYFLNLSAKEAFKAYVRSYESHSLKQVKFDAPSITTTHIAQIKFRKILQFILIFTLKVVLIMKPLIGTLAIKYFIIKLQR